MNNIHFIRGQRVMLDSEVAAMYDLSVEELLTEMKKNRQKLPAGSFFRITEDEWKLAKRRAKELRSHKNQQPSQSVYAFNVAGVILLGMILKTAVAKRFHEDFIKMYPRVKRMIISKMGKEDGTMLWELIKDDPLGFILFGKLNPDNRYESSHDNNRLLVTEPGRKRWGRRRKPRRGLN